MLFSVGYQLRADSDFVDRIIQNKDRIGEVYFSFDGIPVDYTGTLHIGKTFDDHFWKHDEKETPVPFSPETYRENGYIRIEEGIIIEKVLTVRDT